MTEMNELLIEEAKSGTLGKLIARASSQERISILPELANVHGRKEANLYYTMADYGHLFSFLEEVKPLGIIPDKKHLLTRSEQGRGKSALDCLGYDEKGKLIKIMKFYEEQGQPILLEDLKESRWYESVLIEAASVPHHRNCFVELSEQLNHQGTPLTLRDLWSIKNRSGKSLSDLLEGEGKLAGVLEILGITVIGDPIKDPTQTAVPPLIIGGNPVEESSSKVAQFKKIETEEEKWAGEEAAAWEARDKRGNNANSAAEWDEKFNEWKANQLSSNSSRFSIASSDQPSISPSVNTERGIENEKKTLGLG